MEPAMREYLSQLREESYIDIRPGYTDTGASAKQTKPIYSAYTPPAPKKKKKVERARYRESTKTFRQKSAPAGDVAPPVEKPAEQTTAKPAIKQSAAEIKSEKKTQKAGKREKVRYGQAPRETLPEATATKTEDAGALPAKTDVAANVIPDAPVEKEAPKVAKTRYSAHAPEVQKAKKKAKAKTAAIEAAATPAPEDSTEIADRQQQAAPLGLAGDTGKKKKKSKTAATAAGEKTRLADQKKKQADAQKNTDTTTPAPTTAPAPQQ
jgi:peptidyl-prolyl cis-trans isomerase SurA